MILTTSFYGMNQNYKQKKAYFQNFSGFQLYVFKLRMIVCVSLLLSTTTSLHKVFCTRLSVKIALISHWNDFSLIPLEVCFFKRGELQKICKKPQFENFESTLYSTSGSMPLNQIIHIIPLKQPASLAIPHTLVSTAYNVAYNKVNKQSLILTKRFWACPVILLVCVTIYCLSYVGILQSNIYRLFCQILHGGEKNMHLFIYFFISLFASGFLFLLLFVSFFFCLWLSYMLF